MEKKALVSRKKSVSIEIMARVDKMEPRRVPSSRSMGTLRYISREARNGRPIVNNVIERK